MRACNNCGFLALRNSGNEGFAEADALYRERGLSDRVLIPFPVCFAMAADLEKEVHGLAQDSDSDLGSAIISKVVQKDRSDCSQWTPWMRGVSPKEHMEMLIRKEEQDRYGALAKGLEVID